MTLDLDRLSKLAEAAHQRGCWCPKCGIEYYEAICPQNIQELIRLARLGMER